MGTSSGGKVCEPHDHQDGLDSAHQVRRLRSHNGGRSQGRFSQFPFRNGCRVGNRLWTDAGTNLSQYMDTHIVARSVHPASITPKNRSPEPSLASGSSYFWKTATSQPRLTAVIGW